eukprot:TRINITY_DN5607_c0_g1_i1.p1 TRINITY_DN5607_c0_g1~~TRINITY_DN5607_c0_g1_i1.p1  ORF type:complete len:422 (+),score=116.56 TRINITY_DN5607_c0_g1_i1:97-1362(+)
MVELVELLIGCVFMILVLIAGYLFGSRGRKPSKTSQKKTRQNAQQKTQKKTVVPPKSAKKADPPAKQQKVEVNVQQNKKVENSREIPQIDEVAQTKTPKNVQQSHPNKKNMNQKNTNSKSSTQKVTENIKKTINQHPPKQIEDTPTNKGKPNVKKNQTSQPAKLPQPIQAPKIDIKNQNDKQKRNQAQPSQEHPTDNTKKLNTNKKVQQATQPQTETQTDKKKQIDNKNQKTTPTRSTKPTSPTNAGTTQPVKAVKSVQSQAANVKKKQNETGTSKGASGKRKQNTIVAPQASSAKKEREEIQQRVDKRDIERENTNEWVSVDSRSSELDSLKKKLGEFEKEATYLHGFIEGQQEKLKYYTTECSRLTDQKQKQKNDYGVEISKLEKQLDILNDGKKKSTKPVDVLSQKKLYYFCIKNQAR